MFFSYSPQKIFKEKNMKYPEKSSKQTGNTGKSVIVRFRASESLYKRLKYLAQEEETSLAGLVKKLMLDSLAKFPSS
jgi:hypothetical protein